MRSGQTRPGGSSWSVLASPLQGKGPMPTLSSGDVSQLRWTQKREPRQRSQVICAMVNLAGSGLNLGLPTHCSMACFGKGAGLGGALGGPGMLAHFLPGPSHSLLEGTSSRTWYTWSAAACLLGWGLYLAAGVTSGSPARISAST